MVESSFVVAARAAAYRAGVPIERAGGGEPVVLDPDFEPWIALGTAFEASLHTDVRSGRGAHFTPPWLATQIVERVVDAACGPVIDPSCGGGVFLMAALDRLVSCGVGPADALQRLVGCDVDGPSLEVVELAARWWAHAHGTSWAGIELANVDPLVNETAAAGEGGSVPVVVGNPPFLDQLDRASARDEQRREVLQARFGRDVAAYTDDAALFLAWAIDTAGPTGRVGMVLPRSILATRDAEGIRRRVAERSSLRSVWFDEPDTFGAGVRVCVLHTDAGERTGLVEISRGRGPAPMARIAAPDPQSWACLLSAADGVPPVELGDNPTVGDRADVIAGFRDEYYGLAPAVRSSGADPAREKPRLITSGAIDLGELRWADRPIRFAKQRWLRPVIDVEAIEQETVRAWVERLRRPKVLVATQTRVIEAVVDDAGVCVGSVPVLNVIAHDRADVWMVAAAIASPPVNAWALARRAGTALSANALKLAASDVRAIPLPVDERLWSRGAQQFGEAQSAGSPSERAGALLRFGATMTEAYHCDDAVCAWWRDRLGLPSPPA